jgi:hypothetical protein
MLILSKLRNAEQDWLETMDKKILLVCQLQPATCKATIQQIHLIARPCFGSKDSRIRIAIDLLCCSSAQTSTDIINHRLM